jgi:hypothetical protein
MLALRYWPIRKLLLVCVAWFLLSVVAVVGWTLLQARLLFESGEGAGVGAFTISVNTGMLVIPFVPPMILMVAWLAARARRKTHEGG